MITFIRKYLFYPRKEKKPTHHINNCNFQYFFFFFSNDKYYNNNSCIHPFLVSIFFFNSKLHENLQLSFSYIEVITHVYKSCIKIRFFIINYRFTIFFFLSIYLYRGNNIHLRELDASQVRVKKVM